MASVVRCHCQLSACLHLLQFTFSSHVHSTKGTFFFSSLTTHLLMVLHNLFHHCAPSKSCKPYVSVARPVAVSVSNATVVPAAEKLFSFDITRICLLLFFFPLLFCCPSSSAFPRRRFQLRHRREIRLCLLHTGGVKQQPAACVTSSVAAAAASAASKYLSR